MNRRRGLTAAIVGVIAVALGMSAVAGTLAAKKKKTVKLTSNLSGQKEVPPADPDGSGAAKFKMKKQKKQVCYDISFQGIQAPSVAHIHPGAKGVNGPPLITLFESTTGGTFSSPQNACVDAEKSDIKDISKKPKKFYVNIHNEDFPGGAIRGQLKKKGGGGGGSGGGGGNGGGGFSY